MRYKVYHKCREVVREINGAPRNLLQVVMRSRAEKHSLRSVVRCPAETLEYIRSACKISTLSPPASLSARPSPSLPSRPRFTYILSLYFYDASGGFPPSLPPYIPLSLHLVSLSSRRKGGGGLCQPFCALHDMKRTDGRCVSSPPPAHVVSPLRPCRAKRGANERTTRRADGRGRHLCLMDRLKVRKTTRGPRPSLPPPPEFRPNHLCQDKKRKDPSVPFPSQNTRVGSLVSSPRSVSTKLFEQRRAPMDLKVS